MTLVTRKPTGAVPAPNILAAGEEGTGKTYSAVQMSASERFGTVYLIDFGEGCADQYAPLGDYEVVVHDGTLGNLAEIAQAIAKLPHLDAEGRLNAVIFDSVSSLWDVCKDEAERLARDRAKNNKRSFTGDIHLDIWNRVKVRHDKVLRPLLDWPGVTVLTARGRDKANVEGGTIQKGSVFGIESEKRVPFAVDVVLRFEQPRKVSIQKARTLNMQLPADELLELKKFSFEDLVFNRLGVVEVGERNITHPVSEDLVDEPNRPAKPQRRRVVRDEPPVEDLPHNPGLMRKVQATARGMNVEHDVLSAYSQNKFSVGSMTEMNDDQLGQVLDALKAGEVAA